MTPKEEKELLVSVTAKDCRWEYLRGRGAGGQKKNKTSSAVRCTHEPSGAVGYSESHREQSKNKQEAFGKMARSKEMQSWLRIESAKVIGTYVDAETEVDKAMSPHNLKVEKKVNGKWSNYSDYSPD